MANSDQLNIDNSFHGLLRYGLHKPVKSPEQRLEELMGRAHLVGLKEIIFNEIINFLSLDKNKHLRRYYSSVYQCTPLELANKNNSGALEDQIKKLYDLECSHQFHHAIPLSSTLLVKERVRERRY